MLQRDMSHPEENKELSNGTLLDRSATLLHDIQTGKYWTSYFASLWNITVVYTVLCPQIDTIP